ncbi:MAG: signal peptidase II [Paracoccaceae bacterium]
MRNMLGAAMAVVVLDQASKVFVVQVMDLKSKGSIDVLPPLLNFRMAWNEGVNFGLFSNNSDLARWFLITIAVVISTWVAVWVVREGAGRAGQISAGLLIGGAVGNVIDRMVYGAVADFLNMSCCGFDNPFAFNVADIAIFVGAMGLIFFTGRKNAA